MKTWLEVSPYSGTPVMDEDAAANSVAGGGVDMNITGGKKKKSLIDRQMMDARTKGYRSHRSRLETQRAKRESLKNKSNFIDKIKESVTTQEYTSLDLDESKSSTGYELYHKDFSSAMQHAYKFAKSKGYTVDPKEIDDKVATGPSKPSKGKTNSYSLGTNKKQKVQIQVANLDNKKYELNIYFS
jgi:hypothetical protein